MATEMCPRQNARDWQASPHTPFACGQPAACAVMPKASVYTAQDIKLAFQDLDKNGDGFLSYDELRVILVKGNPDFSEKQLRVLWRALDKDRDGNVEFDEFVNYVYGKPHKKPKEVWQDTFYAYSGRDEELQLNEFMRLVSDAGLTGDDFTDEDAEEVFNKVKKPGDVVGPKGFTKAMVRIAKKKGIKKMQVQKAILKTGGPQRNWSVYDSF
mmetsp:Transcript_66801/g.150855  ORF Transcript_66801/g.150855 Transcript_66801/m.150855 type:complete len:212 (-) Transcript_66801:134-769(-)